MDSLLLSDPLLLSRLRSSSSRRTPTFSPSLGGALPASTAARFLSLPPVASDRLKRSLALPAASMSGGLTTNSIPSKNAVYTVGDFMTKKEGLQVVKPTTTVDEALENLVEHRITGFPVIDDDWKLVGVVSDYDLLALDSISGGALIDVLPIGITKDGRNETSLFPEVGSTWKTFNDIQKLLSKTNGKVIGDVMTPAPLVVRESTNLEDAARLLLETKFRRLPVVDSAGRLVGIITRGNVVRAALHIKHANEKMSQT